MRTPVFHHPAIQVRSCEFEYGVFSSARLPAGEVIERSPYLVLPSSQTDHPPLCDYVFMISDDPKDPAHTLRAMALGWGALFNHNNSPNVRYLSIPKRRILEFSTTREISAGEQLFVSYGAHWWSQRGRPT